MSLNRLAITERRLLIRLPLFVLMLISAVAVVALLFVFAPSAAADDWIHAARKSLNPLLPLQPGSVQHRRLGSDHAVEYFMFVPRRLAPHAPVFVTVHGISRDVREHARMFAPFADTRGVLLLAPYFPESRFPDYQRLGRAGRGARADMMLGRVLKEVADLTGANTSKLYMFGYSGGAQFVHRFAMAHPERVVRMVLGAPGWYSFPDAKVRFPVGIRPTPELADIRFEPSRFLRVPARVLVGEQDVRQNSALRANAQLNAMQGDTRLKRGSNWISAMRRAARASGYATPYEFAVMPRCGHWFRECMRRGNMGQLTFDFLFRETLI